MITTLKSAFRSIGCAAALGLALSAPMAEAATVTTNESGLDAVFSQISFGNSPIDVRFNATQTLVNGNLLNIDTAAKSSALFGMANSSGPAIDMFFVDTIDYCGGYNTSIVGCGFVGAAGLMVESIFAAGSYGVELLAHELGHNLGLGHGGCGLMGPALNNNTCLSAAEVSTILLSSLVQRDSNGLYIEINPWLVTAAQIPLPAAGWLLIGGIGVLAAARRRRKTA